MRFERKQLTSLVAVLVLSGVFGATVLAQQEEAGDVAPETAVPAEVADAAEAVTDAATEAADAATEAADAPLDSAAAAVDSLTDWGGSFDDLGVVEETETGLWEKMAQSGAVEFFQKGGPRST